MENKIPVTVLCYEGRADVLLAVSQYNKALKYTLISLLVVILPGIKRFWGEEFTT